MLLIGHVILFLVTGFIQFSYAIKQAGYTWIVSPTLNKLPGPAILYPIAVLLGLYLLGWLAFLTVIWGGLFGEWSAAAMIRSRSAENEKMNREAEARFDQESDDKQT